MVWYVACPLHDPSDGPPSHVGRGNVGIVTRSLPVIAASTRRRRWTRSTNFDVSDRCDISRQSSGRKGLGSMIRPAE